MIYRIVTGFVLAAWMALPTAAAAQERSMIVLDGSGSMWGQIEGRAKIEIARETLREVLGQVPEGNELGLIVYGHRRKGDCGDIELAVKPQAGTAAAIISFADGVSPKGKTPLSAGVRQAAEALRFTEDKATVILVTDGLETCNADPCALGRELEQLGVDFTAHVVGFGLSAEEGAQVACLADETGGRYFEAGNAEALGRALEETVVKVEAAPEPAPEPEPEPEPAAPEFNLTARTYLAEGGPVLDEPNIRWDLRAVDAAGKVEKRATDGRYAAEFRASVPAGEYELALRVGKVEQRQRVTLSATEETVRDIVLNAGIIEAVGKRAEGDAEADKTIRVDVIAGKLKDGAYGSGRFYMPAGEVTVTGRQGKATAEQVVTLAAGETVQIDVVVGSGVVMPGAVYAAGGPVVDSGQIRFDALSPEADITGKRKVIQGVYGSKAFDLPAGRYVLRAKLDEAVAESAPFAVVAGKRTEVSIDLNAGVAGIDAPGAYRIDVLGPADIQGKRKRLAGKYGEAFNVTLSAGDYLVTVQYESDRADQDVPLTVTAGQRSELRVE
ncbi:vWA domain-containing protein [Marimonas arenosa]|uniref:VWA domain-containing protein n=1 Tax=Marimonas arenosa TaxID=1795305 RepID=A0AAE4B7G0_9RHOB|nr:VWA domain-containing protein [Marimonas arenosa]MDQ2091461.1 VWA domain-containing protein [Marimonas arenosa]